MLEPFLTEIERSLSPSELRESSKHLAGLYRALLSPQEVWQLLFEAFPLQAHAVLYQMGGRISPHAIVNALLMRHYPVDRVIRYHFVKHFRQDPQDVVLFEYPVAGKRVDVARVNGQSFAYEIKTEFDHLDRLVSQVHAYATVFEHVAAIVHPSKVDQARECLPEFCSIYTYRYVDEQTCHFDVVHPGGHSPVLSPFSQISALSSSDLAFALRALGETRIPKTRVGRVASLAKYSASQVNEAFKLALKEKYRGQWGFIVQNFNELLPIDIQQFFQVQLEPAIVYGNSSSMVYK